MTTIINRSFNSRPYMNARIEIVRNQRNGIESVSLISWESEIIHIHYGIATLNLTDVPVNYSRSTIQHVITFCREVFNDEISYQFLKDMENRKYIYLSIRSDIVNTMRKNVSRLVDSGTFHDYRKRKSYHSRLNSNIW